MAAYAQWILAILYGTTIHAYLAITVCVFILATSITFHVLFAKKHRIKIIPADKQK